MGLLKKGTKAYSIWNMKCPRCHEGDLFKKGGAFYEMPDRCPECNQNYMPEPGFYYGSMFISYIFTGFFSLGFAMTFMWVLDWSIGSTFALLIFVLAVFFIWIFKISRSIWINVVIHFDPKISKPNF